MAISGIGSYGNYISYQQSISQVRLQQALAKNTRYQQKIQPVDRVNNYDGTDFKSNSMDFLQSYSSAMADVADAANALRDSNSSSVTRELTVASEDPSITVVSERYASRSEKEMTLNVSQLAAAQQNMSAGVSGSQGAAEDMSFTVAGQGKEVTININALNEDGTAKTNRDMLREAVKQINSSDAGVTAAVDDKDGITTLQLKASKTGTDAAFTVTGSMGAAAGAEQAAAEAQNTEYSVTSGDVTRNYTSQTNEITLDAGHIAASLKGTGETTVSVKPDNDKVVSAVDDLVQSYNEARKFLGDNTSHGSGVERQLSNFERTLLHDPGMDKLGISKNKDGTLSLDKDVLKKSLKDEPGLTKQLLSGSGGLAQTAFQRAAGAMSANSASLVSYDLQEINQSSYTDPFQFMNLYSRNGAYNMSNYTSLGLMMNYLV